MKLHLALVVAGLSILAVIVVVRSGDRGESAVDVRSSGSAAVTTSELRSSAEGEERTTARGALAADDRAAEPQVEAAGGFTSRYAARFHVRVRDSAGSPVAGASVALVQHWPVLALPFAQATTDERGEASLGPVDLLRKPDTPLAVAVMGAYDPTHAVAIAPHAPPADTIELVVDPGGELEVEVRGSDGEPLVGAPVRVVAEGLLARSPSVSHTGAPPIAWASQSSTDESGIALVTGFGAGLELDLQAFEPYGVVPREARVSAPSAGETRRVEIRFDPDDVVLRGVLGRSVGSMGDRWTVHVLREHMEWHAAPWVLQSDRAGPRPFRVRLSPQFVAGIEPASWLVFITDQRPAAFFSLRERLSRGEHDLGTIEVPRETLFSGTAHYEDGRPFRGEVGTFVRLEGGTTWNIVPETWGVPTDDAGYFHITGVGEERLDWRLSPLRSGARVVSPETVRPGSRTITLIVASETPKEPVPIRGRVLVDDPSLLPVLEVRLVPSSNPLWAPATSLDLEGRFSSTAFSAAGSGGAVEVGVKWHGEALARIEGVELPGAEEAAVPLEFDLRGRLALARIRASGPQGELADVRLRPLSAPASRSIAHRLSSGAAIAVHDAPLDVIASAPRLRDVAVRLVAGDNEIRFERAALRVRLLWSGFPELPSGTRLRPSLVRGEDQHAPKHYFLDPHGTVAFDAHGVAHLHVPGPGRYVVRLEVVRIASGKTTTMIFEPEGPEPEIHVPEGDSETEFPVHWDPDAVLRVLAALLR